MIKLFLTVYRKSANFLVFLGLGRVGPLIRLNKIFLSHIKHDFIELEEHRLFLDKWDSLGLFRHGVYEQFETEIVKKIIRLGDTVLDVGANIGYFTLIFAKLVGENGKVIAFEPDPTNFNLLKKNIEINEYKNVILVRKALSDKTGKTMLYLSEINSGDHMIINTNKNRNSVEIDMITGDEYLKNLNTEINFIKMDVQGAEINALKGLSSLLGKTNDIKMMIEFAPSWLKNFGNDPIQLLNLLKENGFKLFEIDDKQKKLLSSSSHGLIKKYPEESKKYTNLLCSKNDLPSFEK